MSSYHQIYTWILEAAHKVEWGNVADWAQVFSAFFGLSFAWWLGNKQSSKNWSDSVKLQLRNDLQNDLINMTVLQAALVHLNEIIKLLSAEVGSAVSTRRDEYVIPNIKYYEFEMKAIHNDISNIGIQNFKDPDLMYSYLIFRKSFWRLLHLNDAAIKVEVFMFPEIEDYTNKLHNFVIDYEKFSDKTNTVLDFMEKRLQKLK